MTNRKPPLVSIPTSGEAICASAEKTRALGANFAAGLETGAVLSLEGPLGAGKTQFVKGFVAALAHEGEVSSPTFTIVHEYTGHTPAVHFDWYRLDDEDEVTGLGWDDYLNGGETLLVEWGDKFPELLPAGAWRLRFEIEGESRRIKWERLS